MPEKTAHWLICHRHDADDSSRASHHHHKKKADTGRLNRNHVNQMIKHHWAAPAKIGYQSVRPNSRINMCFDHRAAAVSAIPVCKNITPSGLSGSGFVSLLGLSCHLSYLFESLLWAAGRSLWHICAIWPHLIAFVQPHRPAKYAPQPDDAPHPDLTNE